MPEGNTRRGLWRRIWDALTGSEQEAAVTPMQPPIDLDEVMERRDGGEPLLIPSRGEGFDFAVSYDVVWSATRCTREGLAGRIERHENSVRHDVLERIWSVGREFHPHDPHSAELRMSERLSGGWCYGPDRESVRCEIKIRVNSDVRIGEMQAGYYEQLVAMDCDHMLKLRRMENVACELKGWRQVVEELGDAITVVHAARLVDPEVSAVLTSHAAERRKSAEDLVTVLRDATRDHAQVGLYEFANAYDLAVRSFMQQQGLTASTLAETFEANAQNSTQD